MFNQQTKKPQNVCIKTHKSNVIQIFFTQSYIIQASSKGEWCTFNDHTWKHKNIYDDK